MKRKEDPRFIQGKGNYVDDLSFPGMLYLVARAQHRTRTPRSRTSTSARR